MVTSHLTYEILMILFIFLPLNILLLSAVAVLRLALLNHYC